MSGPCRDDEVGDGGLWLRCLGFEMRPTARFACVCAMSVKKSRAHIYGGRNRRVEMFLPGQWSVLGEAGVRIRSGSDENVDEQSD